MFLTSRSSNKQINQRVNKSKFVYVFFAFLITAPSYCNAILIDDAKSHPEKLTWILLFFW